jgi:hypothetical protein
MLLVSTLIADSAEPRSLGYTRTMANAHMATTLLFLHPHLHATSPSMCNLHFNMIGCRSLLSIQNTIKKKQMNWSSHAVLVVIALFVQEYGQYILCLGIVLYHPKSKGVVN